MAIFTATYSGFYSVTLSGGTYTLGAFTSTPITVSGSSDPITVGGAISINGTTNNQLVGTGAENGVLVKNTGFGGGYYYISNNSNGSGTLSVNSTNPYTFCFLSGTHILTPRGEVLVEELKIGDVISTYDGGTREVLWIGRQMKSRLFSDSQRDIPVEMAAGALGDNLPLRALRLSPDHAILIDGVIVHASALVNNSSIRFMNRGELPDTFTYYHIETKDHALILAEGVPSETFVDNVSRRGFNNWQEYVALYGEKERLIVEMDYPRAHSHRQVPQRIKDRIGEISIDVTSFMKRAG